MSNVQDIQSTYQVCEEWVQNIQQVLYSDVKIKECVSSLAKQISEDYKNKDLLIVGCLTGAVIFYSDLMRELSIPYKSDFISVSSYGSETTSNGNVKMNKDLNIDPKNMHVLIIEDIIDTGHTLKWVKQHIQNKSPASIKTCSLLNKQERRIVDVSIDYIGFECPDEFLVGYGLDFNDHYRGLPFIGILKTDCYM